MKSAAMHKHMRKNMIPKQTHIVEGKILQFLLMASEDNNIFDHTSYAKARFI
jgi:hypothetical protein